LREHKGTPIRLREALSRDEALLRDKDEVIRPQELSNRNCHHRMLNNLQMMVALRHRGYPAQIVPTA